MPSRRAIFRQAELKTATKEKGHGRIEAREYFLETDIDWLPKKPLWSGISAIGAIKSKVYEKGEMRTETRYFIISLTSIDRFASLEKR